jgi:hypothetical protein
MDRKHDGHAWCKVKAINMKNKLNLTFGKRIAWAICNARMMVVNIFFLNKWKSKIAWI